MYVYFIRLHTHTHTHTHTATLKIALPPKKAESPSDIEFYIKSKWVQEFPSWHSG